MEVKSTSSCSRYDGGSEVIFRRSNGGIKVILAKQRLLLERVCEGDSPRGEYMYQILKIARGNQFEPVTAPRAYTLVVLSYAVRAILRTLIKGVVGE